MIWACDGIKSIWQKQSESFRMHSLLAQHEFHGHAILHPDLQHVVWQEKINVCPTYTTEIAGDQNLH
jgi:hypothetical protein